MPDQPENDYTFMTDFTVGSGEQSWEIGILHLPEDDRPVVRYAARKTGEESRIYTAELDAGEWRETTLDGSPVGDVPDDVKDIVQARNQEQAAKLEQAKQAQQEQAKQAEQGLGLSEETLRFLSTPDDQLSEDAIRAKANIIEDFVAEFQIELEDLEPAAIDLALKHFGEQAHQANSRGMHSTRDTNAALDRLRVYQKAADSWLEEQVGASEQAAEDAKGTRFEESHAERELRRREHGQGREQGPSV